MKVPKSILLTGVGIKHLVPQFTRKINPVFWKKFVENRLKFFKAVIQKSYQILQMQLGAEISLSL